MLMFRTLIFVILFNSFCSCLFSQDLVMKGHSKPVADFVFSDDGKSLASIAVDGETIIWNLENKKAQRVTSANRVLTETRLLQFTKEKQPILLAGDWAFGLGIDPVTGKVVGEHGNPKNTWCWMDYFGGRRILSVNKSDLEVREIDTGKVVFTMKHNSSSSLKRLLSPRGDLLATNHLPDTFNNKMINIHELPAGTVRCEIKGFKTNVIDFKWLPNGNLICLELQGDITIWNVEGSPKLVAKYGFKNTTDSSSGLGVSADGQLVAVNKKSITHLFSLQNENFKELRTLVAYPPYAFSADGSYLLASGSNDYRSKQALIFDVKTGAVLQTLSRGDKACWPKFSPDGRAFVVTNASGDIVWKNVGGTSADLLSKAMELPLKVPATGESKPVPGSYVPFSLGRIQFSADQSTVVSYSSLQPDRMTYANLKKGIHNGIWTFADSMTKFSSVANVKAYSLWSDGSIFAEIAGTAKSKSPGPIGMSGMVDTNTGKLLWKPGPNLVYQGLRTSPDGLKTAAVVYRDNQSPQVLLLETKTGKVLQVLMDDYSADAANPIFAFSKDGNRLAAKLDGRTHVWDLQPFKKIPLQDDKAHTDFWLIENGKTLVYGNLDSRIRGIDLDSSNEVFSWTPSQLQNGRIEAIDFSLDGKFALCGSTLGEFTVREARTGKVLLHRAACSTSIGAIGFSNDNRLIAVVSSKPREMSIWKLGEINQQANQNSVIQVDPAPAPEFKPGTGK